MENYFLGIYLEVPKLLESTIHKGLGKQKRVTTSYSSTCDGVQAEGRNGFFRLIHIIWVLLFIDISTVLSKMESGVPK